MGYIVGFFRFWYHFIIGDDWTIAAIMFSAIAVTFWLAHTGLNPWWLLPLASIGTLVLSIRRSKQ